MSETDETVRERAYLLWEQEGRVQGREQDYWRRAKDELDREKRIARPPVPKPIPTRPGEDGSLMVWLGGKWHVWYSRSTLSGIRYVDDGNTEYYSREGKIFQVVTALNEDNSAGAMEIGWLTDAEVWEGDRNEVIRLLESLIARLGNLATIPIENTLCLLDESRRHGIGGNNPPEADHQDRSSLVVQDATEAANMLLSQLRSGNPQLPEVRSSVGELDKAKHALDSFHHWLSEKRDLYATEFAKELGKRTADAITLVGLLNLIGGIVSTIGVIIVLIRHLGL